MSNNRSKVMLGSLLVGSAIGVVAGFLLAPRSGRETRRIIKKSMAALPELAEDLSTSVQLQADRFSESARENWEGTLTRLREAVAAGVEASQQQMQTQHKNSQTNPKESPEVQLRMGDRFL